MLENRKYYLSGDCSKVEELVYTNGYYSSNKLDEIQNWLLARSFNSISKRWIVDKELSKSRIELVTKFVPEKIVNKLLNCRSLTLEQLYSTIGLVCQLLNADTNSKDKDYTTELEDIYFCALEVLRGIESSLQLRQIISTIDGDNNCSDLDKIEFYLSDALCLVIERE